MGFIKNVSSYEELTDDQVREFLRDRAKERKDVITLEKPDKSVDEELRTNMKTSNAKVRMQDLFSTYHTVLRRNGLGRIVKENQKVAFAHIFSAIRQQSSKHRLQSDLAFAHHALKKDFKGFPARAIELAEACQLVDSGSPSRRRRKDDEQRSENQHNDASLKPNHASKPGKHIPQNNPSEVFLCLWEPRKKQMTKLLLRSCPNCPEDERQRILKDRAEEMAKRGPVR